MTFIINADSNKRYNEAIFRSLAKSFILLSSGSFGATEKLLNNYLIQKQKLPLITACLKVIDKAKYSFNGQNEIIISFPEQKIDKLASLITFGTGGKIQGSNILKLAFGQKA